MVARFKTLWRSAESRKVLYPELVPIDAADPRRDLLREQSTALLPLPR